MREFDEVNQAIADCSKYVDKVMKLTQRLLNAPPALAPRYVEELEAELPGFHASLDRLQRAYIALFASPYFSLSEHKQQTRGLRDKLEHFQKESGSLLSTLRTYLTDVVRPNTSPQARLIEGTMNKLAQRWEYAESRAAAILNAFDEHVVVEQLSEELDVEVEEQAIEWRHYIHSNPGILSGKPVVRGTRLAVEFILRLLSAGWTQDDILTSYPRLTSESLRAIYAYAAERVSEGATQASVG